MDCENAKVIKAMYKNNKNAVRTINEDSKEFKTEIRVKWECIFIIFCSNKWMKQLKKLRNRLKKASIGILDDKRNTIIEITISDDMTVLAETEENLQYNLKVLSKDIVKYIWK